MTAGRETFRVGDKVTAFDRFGRVVTGFIREFGYMNTRASALAEVTYLKTPRVLATVEYEPATDTLGSLSISLDVRKLQHAHPELPVGRA